MCVITNIIFRKEGKVILQQPQNFIELINHRILWKARLWSDNLPVFDTFQSSIQFVTSQRNASWQFFIPVQYLAMTMEKVLSTSSGQNHSTSARKRSHRFGRPRRPKLTLISKRRQRNKGQFFKLLSLNPSFPRRPTFPSDPHTVRRINNYGCGPEIRRCTPGGLNVVRRRRRRQTSCSRRCNSWRSVNRI